MSTDFTTHRAGSVPGEPTSAAPGSERKIRILIERATRREPLFHPLDGWQHHPCFPQANPEEDHRRMESA
jgi:hypothetical protein